MPTDVAASSRGAAPLVLVADDEPVVRDLVGDVLGESGYRTVTVANGQEVIDLATRHRPSLIIIDVMMPAMDGYTTVTRLRGDPETASIPVIVMTGQSSPTYRTLSDGMGAVAHVIKPFTPRELAEAVHCVLGA